MKSGILDYEASLSVPFVPMEEWSIEEKIGMGTFGAVFSMNSSNGQQFAVKKQYIFRQHAEIIRDTLADLALLKRTNGKNSYIVPLIGFSISQQSNPRVSIIMPLFIGLKQALNQRLIVEHHRNKYIYQMIYGLTFLHSRDIYHRDFKPSNILYDGEKDCVLLTDFGSSTALTCSMDTILKEDVVTLWYRPPELLLGGNIYSGSADIWGLGCTIFELFTNEALFRADSRVEQTLEIFKVIGTPNDITWPGVTNYPYYEETFPQYHPNWSYVKRKMPGEWYEFIQYILIGNPSLRPTTFDLINSDRFDEYREEIIPSFSCLDNLYLREMPNKTNYNHTEYLALIKDISDQLKFHKKVFFLAAELLQCYTKKHSTSFHPIIVLIISQAYLEQHSVPISHYLLVLNLESDIEETLIKSCIKFLEEIEFDLAISTAFDFFKQYIRLFYPSDIEEIAIEILYTIVITGPGNLLAHEQSLAAIFYACSTLNIPYKHDHLFHRKDIQDLELI